MTIKKQYLKTKPVCKVTFKVTQEQVNNASTVKVVGDFNDWDTDTAPMKRLKNGTFTQTLNLASGKQHQFRYLIDGSQWVNDWQADAYVPANVGFEDNSVINA